MRLLMVSPEPSLQHRVQVILDTDDDVVVAASSSGDAQRNIRAARFDAAVVDARRHKFAAYALELAEGGPMPVVAVVDDGQTSMAAELLAGGVADVLQLTWLEPMLMRRLRAVVPPAPRDDTADAAAKHPRRLRKRDVLIGESGSLTAVLQQIDMIARSDINVLIRGETGTGKELVARTLHATSVRRDAPFVVANCTALPEHLFENELFGHERGAYTGADRRRDGLISAAEGGTLLLDELGDVSAGIQAKLLRLLQFHEYKRIGGTATLKADVRILATTHRDLRRLVDEGTFREDLYYRMNTLEIVLPPLRDRLEDIPLLVDHFVRLHAKKTGRADGAPLQRFTADAIAKLSRHRWPGNVRELENVVNRCLVMSTDFVLQQDDVHLTQELRHHATPSNTGHPLPQPRFDVPFSDQKASVIEMFERKYLEEVMVRTSGNLSKAARLAQHERKSLWRLLKKHGLEPASFRAQPS